MISVRTFGGFTVWTNGRALHRNLGGEGRGLAAFLFVNQGKVFRREKLLDLFWGEQEERRARRALNTALWRLRALLAVEPATRCDALLYSEAGEVRLRASESVDVDAQQMSRCIESLWEKLPCDQPGLNQDEHKALKDSLERYQGPFLEDFENEWVLQLREHLHCIYVRGLLLLMADHAVKGDFERALDSTRLILSIDPLREGVQRHAMRLYLLNGQRAQAIRQFESLTAILSQECGVDPMPETIELHNRIVTGVIFKSLEVERAAVASAPLPHVA